MRGIQRLWLHCAAWCLIGFSFTVSSEAFEPHIEAGRLWLYAHQHPDDGAWGEDPVRETAIVLRTFAQLGDDGIVVQDGFAFLENNRYATTDHLSRAVAARAAAGLPADADIALLLASQNPDGGFGFIPGYPSSLADSLLAAEALQAAGVWNQSVVGKLVYYLVNRQHADGGFSYAGTDDASLSLTVHAAAVFANYQTRYNLASYLDRAVRFILAYQDSRGGFGEGDSTAPETALCIIALHAAGADSQAIHDARSFLLQAQQVDGGWEDDCAATALALSALQQTAAHDLPNLSIDTATMRIEPNYPTAGDRVSLQCTVRNIGTAQSEACTAAVVSRWPEPANRLAETGIAGLAPGAATDITLSWTLPHDNGQQSVYLVLDPDQSVMETTKQDNLCAVFFTSASPADLVVEPDGIVIGNAAMRAGVSFTVSTVVRNTGETAARNVRVVFRLSGGKEPFREPVPVAEVLFAEIPGSGSAQAHVSLNLPDDAYVLEVAADPENLIVESSDLNNTASVSFRVLPAEVQGIDLWVSETGIRFDPAEGRDGEQVTVTVAVANAGDQAAYEAPVVLFDGNPAQGGVELCRHVFPAIRGGEAGRCTLTANFPAGEHRITAVVDPERTIPEMSTINNTACKTLIVHPVDAVMDLAVTAADILFEPAETDAGRQVACRITIRNTGTVRIENIPVRVYDGDPDTSAGPIDPRFPEFMLSGIDAGCTGTITLWIDTTARIGETMLHVVVDPENRIVEDREDNNRAAAVLIVRGSGAPDVTVASADILTVPEPLHYGETVEVRCRVANRGSAATGTVRVAFLIDETVIGYDVLDGIAAGGSADVEFYWDTVGYAGEHILAIVADPDNAIAELNEFNNTARKPLAVFAPDLVIGSDDILLEPLNPEPGSRIAVRCRVRNNGRMQSPESSIALYQGDPNGGGVCIADGAVTALMPGEAAETVFTWTTPALPGSVKLYAVVDREEQVIEEREYNNTARRTLTTAYPADIRVNGASLSFDPASPSVADPITVKAVIENRGGAAAEHVTATIYDGHPGAGDSMILAGPYTIGRIYPDSLEEFSASFFLGQGAHEVCLTVHSDNEPGGTMQENNTACAQVVVGAFSDIEVRPQDMDITPLTPAAGERIRISTLVRNRSDMLLEQVAVRFHDGSPLEGGVQIGGDSVVRLEPGAGTRVEVWLTPVCAGAHDIWAEADPDNAIAEENEMNNTAHRQVVVLSEEPDLSFVQQGPVVSPSQPRAGEPFSLRLHVANFGAGPAQNVAVRFFEDPEQAENARLLGEALVGTVAAGGSAEAAIEVVLTEGVHVVRAVVDPENIIAESHEGNNRFHTTVTVAGGDLFYDDCGNPNNEPHLVQGQDAVLDDLPSGVPGPLATVSIDPEAVVYRYENLRPGAIYELVVGYVREDTDSIVQRLRAGDVILHDAMEIPAGKLRYHSYRIPASAFRDGTLIVRFEKVVGPHAIVSELYLLQKIGRRERAVMDGAAWLADPAHQDAEGGFPPFSVCQSDGLALQALAANNAAGSPALLCLRERVKALQASNGSWDNSLRATSQCIMGLVAGGESAEASAVRNGLAWLLRRQEDTGGWQSDVTGTGMAVAALLDAGLAPTHTAVQRARQWLITVQNPDGFWGETLGASSSINRGYYPVIALIRAGSAQDAAARKAIAYFKNHCIPDICKPVYCYLQILKHTGQTSGSEVSYWKTLLQGFQREDGGWKGGRGYADLSTAEYTGEALTILGQLGGAADAIAGGISWISGRLAQFGDVMDTIATAQETALAALALHAADAQRYAGLLQGLLSLIVARQHASGTWGTRYRWDDDGCNVEATALFLYVLCDIPIDVPGKSTAVAKARQALFNLRTTSDGAWYENGCVAGPSSLRSTSLALWALLRSGASPTDSRIAKAFTWLLSRRNQQGVWNTFEDTARSIMALRMAGNRQQDLAAAVAALENLQNPDGGWGAQDSSVRETAWAVFGLEAAGYAGTASLRGAYWLLSSRNTDGGWAAMPGVPASWTLATAVSTIALAKSTADQLLEVEMILNKQAYYPSDLVRMIVRQVGGMDGLQTVSGSVTEAGGSVRPLAFSRTDNRFNAAFPLRADHPPGTDIVSIMAAADSGQGFATSVFNVLADDSSLPDLRIFGIVCDDEAPVAGRETILRATIANDRLRDATGVVIRWYDSHPAAGGAVIRETELERVCGGEQMTVVCAWTPAAGVHEVYAVADPDNMVAEDDENNNRAMIALTVGRTIPAPDLTIAPCDFKVLPEVLHAGDTALLRGVIRNQGDRDAPQTTVRFYDGPQGIGEDVPVPSLAAGGSCIVETLWDTFGKSGTHYLHAVVDPDHGVAETTDLNNDALRVVEIGPAYMPDLLIENTGVSCSNAHPLEGGKITVTATVKNRGAAVQAVAVALYDGAANEEKPISGTFIYETLQTGAAVPVQFVVDTAGMSGTRTLRVVVDPDNLIDESDEENNSAAADLIVEPCGLQMTVAADKPCYQAGEQAAIAVRISNAADHDRTAALTLNVANEDGRIVHEVVRSAPVELAASEEKAVLHQLAVAAYPAGRYILEAWAEEDAAHRTRASGEFLVAADRTFTALLNVAPPVACPHQQILCSAILRNASQNTAMNDVVARLRIMDETGREIGTETRTIARLLPLEETTEAFYWNTQAYAQGIYTAQLLVLVHDELTAADYATFSIIAGPLGVPMLQGVMHLEADELHRTDQLQARCFVKNSGNAALEEIVLNLQAVVATTRERMSATEDTCSLAIGETAERRLSLPLQNAPAGDAVAVLSAAVGGITQTLAAAPFRIVNQCPMALVTGTEKALLGQSVEIVANGSYDPDNDTIVRHWQILEKPDGSLLDLSCGDTENCVFTPDRKGTYRLRLTVHDGLCESAPADTEVIVENRRPVAMIQAPAAVHTGTPVMLDGSGSYDPDGDSITDYMWTLAERPAGSTAKIMHDNEQQGSFIPDATGRYTIQLVVSDGDQLSEATSAVIEARNMKPVARAGEDVRVAVGDRVMLDGSDSYDPDNDTIAYAWEITAKPTGSRAELSDDQSVRPELIADLVGDYVVVLRVGDRWSQSDPDEIVVHAEDAMSGCDDVPFPECPCDMQRDYEHDRCSGRVYTIASLRDYQAYVAAGYGSDGRGYADIKIVKDITSDSGDVVLHAPCMIVIKKNVRLSAPRGMICIDGRQGIKAEGGFSMSGKSLALLSEKGDIRIGRGAALSGDALYLHAHGSAVFENGAAVMTTGPVSLVGDGAREGDDTGIMNGVLLSCSGLFIKSGGRVVLQNLAAMDVHGPVRLIGMGTHADDAVRIQAAALHAESLCMTGSSEVSIGGLSALYIDGNLSLLSTGSGDRSRAWLKTGSAIHAGSVTIEGFRAILSPWSFIYTPGLFFMEADNRSGCSIHGYYSAGSEAGNCLE